MTTVQEYHSTLGPDRPYTREAALAVLADSDHGLIGEQFARAVCRAFGVPEYVGRYRVDPEAFKGLRAWDDDGHELPTGTWIHGADAAELATHLCSSLGIDYPFMYGRGSRLRVCVRALRDELRRQRPAQQEPPAAKE